MVSDVFLCPRLVEDWLIETRLAKVSIFLRIDTMSCQTFQENAAVKQQIFYKMNQHALVKISFPFWG